MPESDLSKIVSLIMQDPELIERIKGLKSGEETPPPKASEPAAPEEGAVPTSAPVRERARNNGGSERRKTLLHAMMPYVSAERGRAIESMLSIADILDMMKEGS